MMEKDLPYPGMQNERILGGQRCLHNNEMTLLRMSLELLASMLGYQKVAHCKMKTHTYDLHGVCRSVVPIMLLDEL